MGRRTTLLVAFNSLICAYFFIHAFLLGHFFDGSRTLRSDLMQGSLLGFALAFITAQVVGRARIRKANGWITLHGCGEPGNGFLLRAAQAQVFPGPVNVPREAMYWTTFQDGAGRALDGEQDYVLRFPPGGLPPHQAFWSLTMADTRQRFVPNPLERYCVSDRSGLAHNADGSVDIHIQNAPPPGREANWLPAPPGRFTLWLRVYLPGQAILDGFYQVPAVWEAG